jgi:hypothetical protein
MADNGNPVPRGAYKAELRRSRQRHVKAALGEQLQRAGVAGSAVEEDFLQDLLRLQNRTRGAVFEVVGEALVASHLRRRGLDPGTAQRHVCVKTPWGRRFVDLWFAEQRAAVEVKSGAVCARRSLRRQVRKDRWLLEEHPDVDQVVWLLFRGASAALARELERAGIEAVDVQWDVEDEAEPRETP